MALIHAATPDIDPGALCGDRDGEVDRDDARVTCGTCLDLIYEEDEPDSVLGAPV